MNEHLKVVQYFSKSDEVFPHTDIKGGVAITLFDKNKELGPIKFFTPFKELNSIVKKSFELQRIYAFIKYSLFIR